MQINPRVGAAILLLAFLGPIVSGLGFGLYRWWRYPAHSERELKELLRIGMTRDEVREVLGKPQDEVANGSGWIYENRPSGADDPMFILLLFEEERLSEIILKQPKLHARTRTPE